MSAKIAKDIQKMVQVLPEQAQIEAADYLEFLTSKYSGATAPGDKASAFRIIGRYKGTVRRWTREELHER